jgi:hypothetical protein
VFLHFGFEPLRVPIRPTSCGCAARTTRMASSRSRSVRTQREEDTHPPRWHASLAALLSRFRVRFRRCSFLCVVCARRVHGSRCAGPGRQAARPAQRGRHPPHRQAGSSISPWPTAAPAVCALVPCGCLAAAAVYRSLVSVSCCHPRSRVSQIAFRFVLVLQLLQGLEHMHANRQVRRDIKPSNMLIDSNGGGENLVFRSPMRPSSGFGDPGCFVFAPRAVKISDFGLVKQLTKTQEFSRTFVGTMLYLSPERIAGKHDSLC